jgi:rhodanese-related sulfurtransferase
MLRILFRLTALLGISALLVACSATSDSAVTDVGAQEFVTSSSEPGTVVVDVRTPAEYAAGHVEGAVNIDVESSTFGSEIAALPTDTTYAVYCRSGRRSALASDQMADAGFTSVINLEGGVADLQAAGASIVSG